MYDIVKNVVIPAMASVRRLGLELADVLICGGGREAIETEGVYIERNRARNLYAIDVPFRSILTRVGLFD